TLRFHTNSPVCVSVCRSSTLCPPASRDPVPRRHRDPEVSASAPVFAGPFAKPCAACCSLICKPEAKPTGSASSCSGALQTASKPRSHLR
ncbi:mCG1036104, partial [Mus musculus]